MSEDIRSVEDLKPGDWIGPHENNLHLVREVEGPDPDAGLFDNASGEVEYKKFGRKLLPGEDKDWTGDGSIKRTEGATIVERGWKKFDAPKGVNTDG